MALTVRAGYLSTQRGTMPFKKQGGVCWPGGGGVRGMVKGKERWRGGGLGLPRGALGIWKALQAAARHRREAITRMRVVGVGGGLG
jgi:hypothetical protein